MKTDDEQAILNETAAFAEAWSRGDARAAALSYTEDGVRLGAFGDRQTGRTEIQASYARLLHQTMPDAVVKQEPGQVRMLTPELAIWQGGIEIIPSNGGAALKGHVVQVMKKVDGRWLVLEAHPKLFPIDQRPKFWSVAWAWAAAWVLVSIGQMVSGVYNLPNYGLMAYYLLGFAGWAIGAAGTIRYLHQRFGADAHRMALRAAGWAAGALVALWFGLFWAQTWDAGFLGLILGPALGAVIGGAFTLPLRSPASPAAVLRACLRGAISWGAAFLVFQVLAFYAGYILTQMTVNLLAPILGDVWATVPGWALPAGFGGFLAALLALQASKLLHLTERAED